MNGHARTQHLNDAEFSDLLAGEFPDDGMRFHLASCEHCRAELECVKLSLANFTGLGTRWANAVAPGRIPVPPRWAFRLSALPSWPTGLALTALTGLFVFVFGPVGHARSHAPANAAVANAPSKTELANDNRLMLSIDQELGYSDQIKAAQPMLGAQHGVAQPDSSTVLN
ncbi:MAG: hypothetical protein INR62_13725 [Rhodospirillales bacterium]|nr:hypothetical protein [Acetobacter sp.]